MRGSKAGELLLLKEHFERFVFPRSSKGVELTIAKLGNDAGIIGRAWLAKEKLCTRSLIRVE